MGRISLAFSSFFGILFGDGLPPDVALAFGYTKEVPKPPEPPKPAVPPPAKSGDGALQLLGILQRDARLLDFLMEDISAYEDEQVGAAVRPMHENCREALSRYVQLSPVIDSVEGTPTKVTAAQAKDPSTYKLVGNVPAGAPQAVTGMLRHKGWRASKADFPPLTPQQNVSVIAPAEIEIE